MFLASLQPYVTCVQIPSSPFSSLLSLLIGYLSLCALADVFYVLIDVGWVSGANNLCCGHSEQE